MGASILICMNVVINTVNTVDGPMLKRRGGALPAAGTVKLIVARCPGNPDEELAEIEEILLRAQTLTPLLKDLLNICPGSHWGIND